MKHSDANSPPLFTFIVEGSGPFPFDMLRYDSCWPYTSRDAAAIEAHGRRRIVLQTFGYESTAPRPATARWLSFTWECVL